MKILITGDFCPQHRVAELYDKGDFASVLGEVKPIIAQADYSIVNFECPICKGGERPIIKQGPNLKCTEKGLEAIKWVGFDCVTLANNHFLDYGDEGVDNTLAACKKYGVDTVGGGNNLKEASKILCKEIEGEKLAIINCCEHEFSIATESNPGSNPLNPVQQFYAIKEAREIADYVLVIVHGGHEHYQLPSPRMQETYRFFIDAGADAVVNHHQHCYSGYELYNGKPIFYGLGNFCFDNAKTMAETWYEGYLVEIEFNEEVSFDIVPYKQCKESASVVLTKNELFLSRINRLNKVIANAEDLKDAADSYYSACSAGYVDIFEPLFNRFYFALKCRGLIPSFVSKKRIIRALNFVCCESHRDKLLFSLQSK